MITTRRFETAPVETAAEAVQRVLVSTKVCSFGEQVLEKKESEAAVAVDGARRPGIAQFRFERAPLCEYMVNFIARLRSLPDKQMMNSVLENFTIFQVCSFPKNRRRRQRRSKTALFSSLLELVADEYVVHSYSYSDQSRLHSYVCH